MNQLHGVLAMIHRASGDANREQRLGPYVIEALLTREEQGAGTVYRVRVEPHQCTSVSFHKIAEEYYFVLAGRGTAILNGQPVDLKPGDFLRLPPGTTHGFVTGVESLDMLNIHTPGCWPDNDVYFTGTPPEGFGSTQAEPPP